jgi:hypothetical protein
MSTSSDQAEDDLCMKSRKKIITGRLSDVGKKINLSSHEAGKDWKCSYLKCFENIIYIDVNKNINIKLNQSYILKIHLINTKLE